MYKISDDYKNQIENSTSLMSRSKIVVDGVEYSGNLIKTAPKIFHKNSKMIGGFPTKTCSFEIYDLDNKLNFENKEIYVYRGIVINGVVEYIPQGIFIPTVDKIETNISLKTISFNNIQDKTQFFDKKYESHLDWSETHTGLEIVQEICSKLNIILETKEFNWYDYNFKQPNFSENTTYREVISRLAEIGGNIAFINRNGNLEIKGQTTTNHTISRSRYSKLSKESKYGDINIVVLGNEGIDNDIVFPEDLSEEKIEWKIYDNPFVDLYREEMIEKVSQYIIGRSIIPFTLENFVDAFYLDLNDVISITSKTGETFDAVILNYESTSRIKSKISADVQEGSITDYNLAGSNKESIREVKLQVNHNANEIDALAKETSENSERITQTILSLQDIQNIFQITGGNNLIKNSVGLFGNEFWNVPEGADVSFGEDTDLIGKTTSCSKITLKNTTISTSSDNIINLSLNLSKTFCFKIKQDEDVETSILIYGRSKDNPYYAKTLTGAYDWEEIYVPEENIFSINDSNLTLEITSTSTYEGKAYISDLMLVDGEKRTWQPSSGEVWGTVIKMSQMGISCYSRAEGYVTLFTTQGVQIRELNGDNIGDIITKFDLYGISTGNLEQTGYHKIQKLITTKINSNNREVYCEYIQD